MQTSLCLLAAAAGLATACTSDWIEHRYVTAVPGYASVSGPAMWLQDEPQEVDYRWGNASICNFDEWGCEWAPGITVTVLSVSCTGCTLLDDPTGTTIRNQAIGKFRAMATEDGTITVAVTMRYDATGTVTTQTYTTVADREVAVDYECGLVDRAELQTTRTIPRSMIRPCQRDRTATDVVAVFPQIRTLAGQRYFPWCIIDCTSWLAPRPITELTTTPAYVDEWNAEYAWGHLTTFLEVPVATDTTMIELRGPMLHGPTQTTRIDIPPLRAPAP